MDWPSFGLSKNGIPNSPWLSIDQKPIERANKRDQVSLYRHKGTEHVKNDAYIFVVASTMLPYGTRFAATSLVSIVLVSYDIVHTSSQSYAHEW